jgi:ribosomal subunit interface protein
MQLIIESPHLKISHKLEELIRDKVNHLDRLHHRLTKCVVLLKKEKNDQNKTYRVETRLLAPRKIMFASEQAENFEAALYQVVDDLAGQLRKNKREREREEIW